LELRNFAPWIDLQGTHSAFSGLSMYPPTPEEEKADLGEPTRGLVAGTQLFQRFTLQKVLGRGEMSVVWLAHEHQCERLVALKLVPESPRFGPAACEDLRHETRKSFPLIHANIVRTFDFIADQGMAAICMEYVDGAPLSYARMQKRSNCFGILEVVPWITSLCDALVYAHESADVMHRGLRPANMMLNSRAHLQLTDFGTAASLRDSMSRANGSVSGEMMQYLSPQQLLGEDPSPSDDIYSLGATLYEMLSSKPPFYRGDVASQVREVLAPPINQRRITLGIAGDPIPRYWEETIAACLAKEREDRPRSAAEVASRLRLGGTVRLTVAREIPRPVFQRYLRIGALAGAAAALIAAATILYRSDPPPARAAVLSALKKETPPGYAIEAPAKTSVPPTEDAPSMGELAKLQLATTPAGATFAIYPGVLAGDMAPVTAPLRSGTAPESIEDLPPGRYTILFHYPGWPDDHAEIAVQPGETLPIEYTFPHGSVTITSTPESAEIFAGENALGHTPLTVDLPLGKQELVARHPDFPKQTETVTIEKGAVAKVAFQLRARPAASKSKESQSAWGKFGNTLKKVFSSKPPPKKKPNP
jgi:serine/threonine protein kinase